MGLGTPFLPKYLNFFSIGLLNNVMRERETRSIRSNLGQHPLFKRPAKITQPASSRAQVKAQRTGYFSNEQKRYQEYIYIFLTFLNHFLMEV